MKKIALAAALTAAFAGSAFAQSSVTLYGRINTTVEFQDNETTDRTVMNNNASRWGLRGNEDLGGGLSAFFQLENGFGSDTGAGAGGFNRDAFVGIKSASLGQLKFGRIGLGALYASTIDYIGVFNHNTGTTSEDNLYSLNIGFQNAVEYTSPNFGPVSFAVTANASEGTGNKTYEGVVNFDQGSLHIGAGVSKTENQFKQDVIEGASAAIAYGFGPVLLGLNYEYSDASAAFTGGTALGKRNQVTFTGMYTLGANEFHLSAGWADEWDNAPNSDAIQWTLGYNYNLSKRTKLYAFYYSIENKSGTPAAVVYGPSFAVPGDTLSVFGAGIRHNF
ncbi:MAG TPA: porin [Methylibium sp.]|uniref:porin n=1 Tax=Methylibium sp. TaxID=2067992 RepID=UPI002DB92564|nr:porin [Methylibium sp.]HEU4458250.1 porin [Methylibium sp.]